MMEYQKVILNGSVHLALNENDIMEIQKEFYQKGKDDFWKFIYANFQNNEIIRKALDKLVGIDTSE